MKHLYVFTSIKSRIRCIGNIFHNAYVMLFGKHVLGRVTIAVSPDSVDESVHKFPKIGLEDVKAACRITGIDIYKEKDTSLSWRLWWMTPWKSGDYYLTVTRFTCVKVRVIEAICKVNTEVHV